VYLHNLGVLAELVADLSQHLLLVVDAWPDGGLLRQMICNVSVDQVLNGRCCPARPFVTGGIDALVDLFA
jgi:hypothetical protein